jgi:putative transposase
MKRSYPTDLSDAEWKHIEPFVPAPKCRGRQRIHSPREILNAVFYILRSGCPWRLLPREYPPWKTVYHYFREWRINGTFEKLNAVLRAARALADMLGQEPAPQRRDSRLAVGKEHRSRRRTTRLRRRQEGSHARKRHLLVDTEGLVLKAKVHSAKIPEQDGLKMLLGSARAGVSYLKHLWLDAGYEGRGKRWAEEALGLRVEIVRKPAKPVPEKVAMIWAEEWAKEGKKVDWQRLMLPRGFKVLPRRWVVERTFSWLDQNRRMSLGTTSGCVQPVKRSSTWR